MLQEVASYARTALGWRRFLKTAPATDPASLVRSQLENREFRFVELMRRAVFANPENPYTRLFRWAGCDLADLDHSTRRDGLEAALEGLRKAGVYLGHDAFKGKTPIRRGGAGRGQARRHVEMFSNEDTLRLPSDVRQAMTLLFERVARMGIGPTLEKIEIIEGTAV